MSIEKKTESGAGTAFIRSSLLPKVIIGSSSNCNPNEEKIIVMMTKFFSCVLRLGLDEIILSDVRPVHHIGPRQSGIRVQRHTGHNTISTIFLLPGGNRRFNVEVKGVSQGVVVSASDLFKTVLAAMDNERDLLITEKALGDFRRTGTVPFSEQPKPAKVVWPLLPVSAGVPESQLALTAQTSGVVMEEQKPAPVVEEAVLPAALPEAELSAPPVSPPLTPSPAVAEAGAPVSSAEAPPVPASLDAVWAARYRFNDLVKGLRERTQDGAEPLSFKDIFPLTKQILGLTFDSSIIEQARFARILGRCRILRKIAGTKPPLYKLVARGYDVQNDRPIIRVSREPQVTPPAADQSVTGRIARLERLAAEYEEAKTGFASVEAALGVTTTRLSEREVIVKRIAEIDAAIAELRKERDGLRAKINLRGVHWRRKALEVKLRRLRAILESAEHQSAASKIQQLVSLL